MPLPWRALAWRRRSFTPRSVWGAMCRSAAPTAITSTAGASAPTLSVPILGRGPLLTPMWTSPKVPRNRNTSPWRQSVLVAIEEVENALYSIGKFAQAASSAERAVNQYGRALSLSRELSRNGQITILEVVESERQIANAREAQAQSLRQLALEHVALNVALGAGYAADAGYGGGKE